MCTTKSSRDNSSLIACIVDFLCLCPNYGPTKSQRTIAISKGSMSNVRINSFGQISDLSNCLRWLWAMNLLKQRNRVSGDFPGDFERQPGDLSLAVAGGNITRASGSKDYTLIIPTALNPWPSSSSPSWPSSSSTSSSSSPSLFSSTMDWRFHTHHINLFAHNRCHLYLPPSFTIISYDSLH